MITTSKTSVFSYNDIGILVKTSNQNFSNNQSKQPCLWLIHGSGGISSNEDLWIEKAFKNGYAVIIVDSYSNRGIFKQFWESVDEYRITPEQRAKDIILAHTYLKSKADVVPFLDLNNNINVGFSDGGTAGIWLQQAEQPDIFKMSFCLYPGLKPTVIPEKLYKIKNTNVHIFVGELDNWTPAMYDIEYQKSVNCKLTVWPNTHHSFSKPGVDSWHHNTLNYKRERGVYCKYNEDATQKTMDIVFNE